jgi:hypothetical protein
MIRNATGTAASAMIAPTHKAQRKPPVSATAGSPPDDGRLRECVDGDHERAGHGDGAERIVAPDRGG